MDPGKNILDKILCLQAMGMYHCIHNWKNACLVQSE